MKIIGQKSSKQQISLKHIKTKHKKPTAFDQMHYFQKHVIRHAVFI